MYLKRRIKKTTFLRVHTALRYLLQVSGLCLAIVLAGCDAHVITRYQPQKTNPNPMTAKSDLKRSASLFAVPRRPLKVTQIPYPWQRFKGYHVSTLTFTSVGENGQAENKVTAHYFKSQKPGPKKLLVILPIWGSFAFPARRIAHGILKASKGNVNVISVLGNQRLIDWKLLENAATEKQFRTRLHALARRTINTVIDTKRLIAWAIKQKANHPQKVVLLSFSIGGIAASLITNTDPNVTGAIFVIGGADPVDIMHTCHYQPKDIRQAITTRFDWSAAKYKSVLRQYLSPLAGKKYPIRPHPKNVLIIDAKYDRCISAKTRNALWKMFGKPTRITILNSHSKSFVTMTPFGNNFMNKKIYEFVERGF